jgi:Fur family transcriptional regulator, ferric uptake regulator
MSHSHAVAPVEVSDVDSAVAALRSAGLRVSAARRLVLEAFFSTDDPLTAEEVAGGLDGRVPSSNLASVYRNLETLEEAGLLRHFHLGHGPGLYARVGAETREYLVCDRCGHTLAVEPSQLEGARAAIRSQTGWQAHFSHFPVAGLCPACVTGDRGTTAPERAR